MSEFDGMFLTKKGKNLMAKGQIGTVINFTKVVLGDGVLAENQNIEDLEAVINAKKDLNIHSLKVIGDGTSQVRVILNNEGLANGFFVREIALMATDPDDGEILYAYANAGDKADFMPSGGGSTVVENQLDLITVVGNAPNITAKIGSVVLALKEDISDHDADLNAHDGRLSAIEDSIKFKNEYDPHKVQLELFSPGYTLYDSTTWKVDQASGKAVAIDGGVYEVHGLKVHDLNQNKAAVVRRTDNDAVLNGFFKDADHTEWTPAPWEWKRNAADGMIDVEYQVPARGVFSMRFESAAGASAVDPEIDHIIFIECEPAKGGLHTPPATPTIVSPVDGATGISEQPGLTTGAFSSPVGENLNGVRFQISTTPEFTAGNIVADSGVVEGISWSPDKGVLTVDTSYYVRALHVDIAGGSSAWSPTVSFTMAPTFITVDKPSCITPAANDELYNPDGLTLVSSAFAADGGSDTHKASQWQIANDSAFTDIIHDSNADTTNKTNYNVPDSTVARGNTYYWRVRHEGTTGGWSDWSNVVIFSISTFIPFVATLERERASHFYDVIEDSKGDIYAVGYNDATDDKALIIKFKPDGTIVWKKEMGTADSNSRFYGVDVDKNDNIYAAGVSNILKINSSGVVQWRKSLDGPYAFEAVAVDDSGNAYAVGSYDLGSNTRNQAFIAKYDTNGNPLWQKALTNVGTLRRFFGVSIGPDGSIYAAGECRRVNPYRGLLAKFHPDGSLIWQRTLKGEGQILFRDISTDTQGNLYVAGDARDSVTNYYHSLIAKYNSDGSLIWQKTLSGQEHEHFYGIHTMEGAVYAVGCHDTAERGLEALITKYDTDGGLLWHRTLGGTVTDYFQDVSVGKSIIIVGYGFRSTTSTYNKSLIASIDGDATGTNGPIPDITYLMWDTPTLTVNSPSLISEASSLLYKTLSLTSSDWPLTENDPALTHTLSQY